MEVSNLLLLLSCLGNIICSVIIVSLLVFGAFTRTLLARDKSANGDIDDEATDNLYQESVEDHKVDLDNAKLVDAYLFQYHRDKESLLLDKVFSIEADDGTYYGETGVRFYDDDPNILEFWMFDMYALKTTARCITTTNDSYDEMAALGVHVERAGLYVDYATSLDQIIVIEDEALMVTYVVNNLDIDPNTSEVVRLVAECKSYRKVL